MCVRVCVSKVVIGSGLSCLPGSVSTGPCRSMATILGAAGPHPPLSALSPLPLSLPLSPPSLPPCLQKIHSVKYRRSVAVGLARLAAGWERGGPSVGLGSRGTPHAHALQHALPWRLSCYCATPTLVCVCQQWPCALSLAVLFMGTREVARRVAGSGRGFFSATLQLVSCFKKKTTRRGCRETSGCWAA